MSEPWSTQQRRCQILQSNERPTVHYVKSELAAVNMFSVKLCSWSVCFKKNAHYSERTYCLHLLCVHPVELSSSTGPYCYSSFLVWKDLTSTMHVLSQFVQNLLTIFWQFFPSTSFSRAGGLFFPFSAPVWPWFWWFWSVSPFRVFCQTIFIEVLSVRFVIVFVFITLTSL